MHISSIYIILGLLAVNSKLSTDLRDLQRAMEQDRHTVEVRLREAEQTNDQLRGELDHVGEEQRLMMEDTRRKIEALEKQLRTDKQFLEVFTCYS